MSNRAKLIALSSLSLTALIVGSLVYYRSRQQKHKDDQDESVESTAANEFSVPLACTARSKGNKFYNEKKIDEAIESYSESIRFYPPDHPERALAFANRAACHLIKLDFHKVIQDCSDALAIDKMFLKALDRRSRAFDSTGKYFEALVDATAACLIDDFKTESLVKHVDSILENYSNHYIESQTQSPKEKDLPGSWYIQEYLETFPDQLAAAEILISRESTHKELQSALQSALSKDYVTSFHKFLAVEDQLNELQMIEEMVLHNWLASFYFLKGDLENCYHHLQCLLKLNSSDPNALIKMALVHLENNRIHEAVQVLENSEQLSRNNPSFYCYRGDLLALSGNLDAAIADFEHAINIKDNFVIAMCRKARCLVSLGQVSAAKEYLLNLNTKFPQNVQLILCLAETCVLLSQFDQFNTLITELISINPYVPSPYYTKALALLKQGKDKEEVDKLIRQALSVDPTFVDARIQLAQILALDGNFAEAELEYDKAICNSRTKQEAQTICKLKIATLAQYVVSKSYPDLESKINSPRF